MTNPDVAIAFARRLNAKTEHLHTDGDKLFSYGTCIAQWTKINDEDTVIVNTTRYSNTTSHHQSNLRAAIKDIPTITIAGIPIGCWNLIEKLQCNKKMKRITNKEVVEAFCRRDWASTTNLESTGNRLISFDTCIAEWLNPNFLILNRTYYNTFMRNHVWLLDKHYKFGIYGINTVVEVRNVPEGELSLIELFINRIKLKL